MLELITTEMEAAFEKAGYDKELAKVTLSNRPDLCEYQCNGAMAGAKKYKKAPFMIAEDVAVYLKESSYFETVEVVKPGFINLKLAPQSVADYLNQMSETEKLGVEEAEEPKTIMIDYGGPNVAKPLHVGHLRSAIIGESVKRITRFKGNKVIGDIHLGDWGYQMGLIITELKKRKPELPYFDENFTGEYPAEAPFTIGELEEIYPTASSYAKEDEEYRKEALHATYLLQNGHRGYRAVWNHIMNVSVTDLKKNYERLNVEFDLWKGEADAQKYIPDMVQMLKEEGYARYDEGALVVDVQEESDKKDEPQPAPETSQVDDLWADALNKGKVADSIAAKGEKKGSPQGSVESGALAGSPGYGDYDLGGRGLIGRLPKPEYAGTNDEGTIVVEVLVDPQGRVVQANVTPSGSKGTAASNVTLRSRAEAAARKAVFEHKSSGNENQWGSITYYFKQN